MYACMHLLQVYTTIDPDLRRSNAKNFIPSQKTFSSVSPAVHCTAHSLSDGAISQSLQPPSPSRAAFATTSNACPPSLPCAKADKDNGP